MPRAEKPGSRPSDWKPIPDPDGRYSSGIPDFDRLLGGGFAHGSMALYEMDETLGQEDLDLLLFPTVLNLLYHSRGVLAVLPSRDSPHEFRSRLSPFVTRRRFDNRVRVIDYVGEDEGPAYVVNLNAVGMSAPGVSKSEKQRQLAASKMENAERAAQGHRKKSFLELMTFEVADTLMGSETAAKMFFYGVKRARSVGNLVIGLLGPGVGCEDAVRRMADTRFALHRDEVGLVIRGIRPSFPSHVVTRDLVAGPPHVDFVPRPS